MNGHPDTAPGTDGLRAWISRALYLLNALLFLAFGLSMVLRVPTPELKAMMQGLEPYLVPIGLAELAGLGLYLFPRTAGLGVLYLTAHLGACAAIRLVNGYSILLPAATLLSLWASAWLRNPSWLTGFRPLWRGARASGRATDRR